MDKNACNYRKFMNPLAAHDDMYASHATCQDSGSSTMRINMHDSKKVDGFEAVVHTVARASKHIHPLDQSRWGPTCP